MNTTPTPAEFLAQPSDPEDDVDETPVDPLESIADSLRTLVTAHLARVAEISVEEARVAVDESVQRFGLTEDELQGRYDSLDRAYEELARDFDARQAKLDEVLALVKPSTSKLANAIRAVLLPPAPVAAEAPVDTVTAPPPPPDDAPVERWRSYAVGQGHDFADVGEMNRSQIRTLLGLPHTGEVSA